MTAMLEHISGSTRQGMSDLIARAFASVGTGVLITDATHPEHPIVFANQAFCRMTGYTAEEVIGKNCRFLQNGDNDQPALADVRTALANGDAVSALVRNYRKDGSLFWNQLFIAPVPDDDGTITHYIGIHTDVTQQRQQQERLLSQVMHDPLTHLPSRQQVKTHLDEAILQARNNQEIVGLLIVNIDHFTRVNDAIGYDGADELLKSFATRLRNCIQDRDSLCRHGVDEFAIVLRGAHKAQDITAIAGKLSRTVSEPFPINGESVCISCSIGISLYPQDEHEAATLIRYANIALQRAKELGRNNTQAFSRELNERALERATLETALRSAIDKNELSLHYQPLVDLQTGQVTALEALSRWHHPELGEIRPSRFIAVAEESGLIEQLGEWALRRACHDMRTWLDAGLPEIQVSVNVSPRQFRDPLLADKIGSALAVANLSPQMLSLEITENILMQDTPASEATLVGLQTLGVDLVLDDFGTGYSSLGYLKRFSFKKVKIDQSFVRNIATDADDGAIAKAIISMAHSLGIRVVAEGVETESQCDFLRRNMCDEIQGFLFSRALPVPDVATMLRTSPCLPEHLLRFNKPARTLLLVDDEVNIVAALKRLLRRDNYTILTANSGQEGLDILAAHDVDVIVSDQRMPSMTGVEFLRKAKETHPDTVRIMLSGYTELQSVTDAVNEGSIYKFLVKPWDDAQLREHIEEAFQRKELADENRRLNLEVRTANFELAAANRRLEEVLAQQQQKMRCDEVSLDIVREALRHVPVPVIGLDEEDIVVFINSAAQTLLADHGMVLGSDARDSAPDLFQVACDADCGEQRRVELKNARYLLVSHRMGKGSESRGRLITLTPE